MALMILLSVFSSDGAAAWSAHLGHGKAGAWTFAESTCQGSSCFGWGRFVSDDGSDVRDQVSMFDTPQRLHPGEVVRAVSIDDDQIFPAGGGTTWFGKLVGVVVTGVLLGFWGWRVPGRWVRRLDRRRRLWHH